MKRVKTLKKFLFSCVPLCLFGVGCATTTRQPSFDRFLEQADAVGVVRVVSEDRASEKDAPIVVQAAILKVLKGPLEERTTFEFLRHPLEPNPAFVPDKLNVVFLRRDANSAAWICDARRGRGTVSFAAEREALDHVNLELIRLCMERFGAARNPRTAIFGKDGIEVREVTVSPARAR